EAVAPRLGGPFAWTVGDPWDVAAYTVGAAVSALFWGTFFPRLNLRRLVNSEPQGRGGCRLNDRAAGTDPGTGSAGASPDRDQQSSPCQAHERLAFIGRVSPGPPPRPRRERGG